MTPKLEVEVRGIGWPCQRGDHEHCPGVVISGRLPLGDLRANFDFTELCPCSCHNEGLAVQ